MAKPITKVELVAELARSAGVSRRRAGAMLDALAQIAYREARNKFTIPGICILEVVRRQERRARNPATQENILIAAHDALRVRPLRKAKLEITPQPDNFIRVLPTDYIPPASATENKSSATPASEHKSPAHKPDEPPVDVTEKFISFRCKACSQEIEAPMDMALVESECPSCGNSLKIPPVSEPGTIWGGPLEGTAAGNGATSEAPLSSAEEAALEAMKSRTIRIELPDDF